MTRLIELLGTIPGYAVEVGAADGEFTSQTHVLENLGWEVLCIEPNPIYAAKARATRALVDECAAADFSEDNVDFTLCNVNHDCKLHEMQGGSALQVNFDQLEKLGWKPKGTRTIKVRVRTVDELLELYGFPRLDFISIDTEGTEDAVLRGLNVDKWLPRVISVENWPGVNKTDHLLLPLGYSKIEPVAGNYTDWYAR